MPHYEAKVCILGNAGVGKSSLIQRYVHNTFDLASEATIGANYVTKTLVMGPDRTIKFNIWDTAGQEKYRSLAPMYYRASHACIIVYDVTDKDSFRSVTRWIRELQAHSSNEFVLAIAANKSDLVQHDARGFGDSVSSNPQIVSSREAKAVADSYGAIFIETSAKNSMNMSKLFMMIASRIRFPETRNSVPSLPSIKYTDLEPLRPRKRCC